MEYRKLISFGKSSFVVSMPKPWVTQNNLKKGDLIYMEESGSSLILNPTKSEKVNHEKTKVIGIDGKDISFITREVNSSYILNNHTIVIKGKEVKERVEELQQVFQNLMALEVMEQTSDSILAKDFLNIEQVSTMELIRKMDIITRTMIKECSEKDSSKSLDNRDKDVNRLYFLLYRTILYNLDNPSNALKRFKTKMVELVNQLFIGFYIEAIADEVRRIARFSNKAKLNSKEKVIFTKFIDKLQNIYLETMKSIYNNDVELALKLSNEKVKLNQEIDSFEKWKSDHNLLNTTYRMRRFVSCVHNLGRIVYQGINYYQ